MVLFFLLLYVALTLVWQLPAWGGVYYLCLSGLCYAVYARDKAAAPSRRHRTPERTLHLLALLGGWPGAALAQRWLRHKSGKHAFLAVYRLTVLANCVLLVALSAWLAP